MKIEDLIRRYMQPLFAPEDEGGAGGAGGEGGDTGGDAGAGGGDAAGTGDQGTKSAVLDGGTAESDDNASDGDTSDKSGGDTDKDADKGTEDKDDKSKDEDQKDGDGEGDESSYEEFTVPEGVEMDQSLLGAMTPLMREAGLSQEQAQAMVDSYAAVVQQQADDTAKLIRETFDGWVETAKKDTEIGGDKWDRTVERANAVIRQFGTKEFIDEVLVGQGVGNHPEVIRFMSRVASQVLDDSAPTGKQTDTSAPVTPENTWYGETTPSAKKG